MNRLKGEQGKPEFKKKKPSSDDILGIKQRARVVEACAITAYHQQTDIPKITALLSDDAPQFKLLVDAHGLCWIHDGRHYKKLKPLVPEHREKLEQFRQQYWEYYGKLHRYKQHPTPAEAQRLELEFERLFSTITRYEQLDERIAKTLAKKTELLIVLGNRREITYPSTAP